MASALPPREAEIDTGRLTAILGGLRASPSPAAGAPTVLLRHLDGGLSLTAFAGPGMGVQAHFPARTERGFTAEVPVGSLLSVLRASGPRAAISRQPDGLHIRSDGSEASLRCRPRPVERPPLDGSPLAAAHIDAEALASAAADVSLFASGERGNPHLRAVEVAVTPTGLVLTATDGYRVASRRLAAAAALHGYDGPTGRSGTKECLVDPADLAAAAAAVGPCPATVAITPTGLTVESPGEARFWLAGLSGAFPDCKAAVGERSANGATAASLEVGPTIRAIESLDAADGMARHGHAVLAVVPGSGLRLSASGADGHVAAAVPARTDGPATSIEINRRMLADALAFCGGPSGRTTVAVPAAACVPVAFASEPPASECWVMPLSRRGGP